MKAEIKNLPASVLDRLRNIARAEGRVLQEILTLYGLERFLHRLSVSSHREQFVLKGALVMQTWPGGPSRTTSDIDLRALVPAEPEAIAEIIQEVCLQRGDDAIEFDPGSIRLDPIIERAGHPAYRVRLRGKIARTQLSVQIDLGFTDPMVPPPVEIAYPTLLGHPKPKLRAYRLETIVAEKLEAIVQLGDINTRMKDYFDLWHIASRFQFEGTVLAAALKTTFESRGTDITDHPDGFSQDFVRKNERLWRAFLERIASPDADSWTLEEAVEQIRRFAVPVLKAAASENAAMLGQWETSLGWSVAH